MRRIITLVLIAVLGGIGFPETALAKTTAQAKNTKQKTKASAPKPKGAKPAPAKVAVSKSAKAPKNTSTKSPKVARNVKPAPKYKAPVSKKSARAKGGRAAVAAAPARPMSILCMDAASGKTLYEYNADIQRPPASMVKMMMMLMVAEGAEKKLWGLDETVTISKLAQSMGGTQVNLAAGDEWEINELCLAMAVASANDAACALAEGLWGSVADYLLMANARARQLGMKQTVIRSTNGLPPADRKSFDQTSARDMAILARECIKHKKIMQWVGTKSHAFHAGASGHPSTNKLLGVMPECDGLKTGYINASGFCFTATAKRDDLRLICVVMGAPNVTSRFRLARQYLEWGFNQFEKVHAVQTAQAVGPIKVACGDKLQLSLKPAEDLWVTIKREDRPRLEIWAEHPRTLVGPLNAGQQVGEVQVTLDGAVLARSPLLVPEPVAARGWQLALDGPAAHWVGLDNPPATTREPLTQTAASAPGEKSDADRKDEAAWGG